MWRHRWVKNTHPPLNIAGTSGFHPRPDIPYLIDDCAGFNWYRVNFLHSSYCGAMFWICAENSIDNTEMFLLLLSSAYIESRPFLLLTPPHQWAGWRCTRRWEGTQPGQLTPADQRDIPYHMASCSAYKAGGKRRRGWHSEWWRLSSQVTITCDEALLSWRCTACQWEIVFCFACAHSFFFTY